MDDSGRVESHDLFKLEFGGIEEPKSYDVKSCFDELLVVKDFSKEAFSIFYDYILWVDSQDFGPVHYTAADN